MLPGERERLRADTAGGDDPPPCERELVRLGHDLRAAQEPFDHRPRDRAPAVLGLDGPAVFRPLTQGDDVQFVGVWAVPVLSLWSLDPELAGLTRRG